MRGMYQMRSWQREVEREKVTNKAIISNTTTDVIVGITQEPNDSHMHKPGISTTMLVYS